MIYNFRYDKPEKYFEPKQEKVAYVLDHPNEYKNFIATQKFDGEWCRIILAKDHEPLAQSRSISVKTKDYTDRTEFIPHIIKELQELVPEDTVLLGELCFFNEFEKTSKDVGTILRCLPKKALERQKKTPLFFVVFDCLAYGGESFRDLPYGQRLDFIKDKVNGNFVKITNIYSIEKAKETVEDIWSRGGEGLVLHNKSRLYSPGSRLSGGSMKVKKKMTPFIIDVERTLEPNKEYNGNDPYWEFEIDGEKVTRPFYFGWKNGIVINYNGMEVNVASGLTDHQREWLATEEAQNLIKEKKLKAEVVGMSVTETGSIRHPQLLKLIKQGETN